MIKHVFSSIPLDMLTYTLVSKSLFATINKILARFFQADRDYSQHKHLVAWNAMSSTLEEGVLAIIYFQDVSKVMSMKMASKLVTETSL